jgi:transcriptional regulator with XRE-family HTH domain
MFVSQYPELQGALTVKGISFEEYGKALGLSKKAIYQRMRGDVDFKRNEITKTCEVLGCSLSEVIPIFFGKQVS